MEDILSIGFWIIVGALILKLIISAIVDKIQEPFESKARLIDLEQEKAKCEKLSKDAEEAIARANEAEADAIEKIVAAEKSIKEKHEKDLQKAKTEVANAVGKQKQYFSELIVAKEEMKRKFAFHPELVTAFLYEIDEQKYYESIMQGVLQHAFDRQPEILNVNLSATIHSCIEEKEYVTTLSSCTCSDHAFRGRPCKHMLYLAYLLGLLQIHQKDYVDAVKEYNDLGVKIAELREEITREQKKHKKLQAINIEVQNAINEKPNAYPRISGLMADLVALQFKDSEIYLRSKTPPAHKAADEVARMREKARNIEQRNKEFEEKLETLHRWFPNIDDVFDTGFKVDMWELETREPTAIEIKDYISKYINSLKYENLK